MFFSKKYVNPEIEADIQEKWFSVYNYISLDELLMTVQRDYLSILSVINIPFWIISIIIGFINIGFLLGFLIFVYWIIFISLCIKLVMRSYYFLKISDVVYTKKGIILGQSLYTYGDDTILVKKLWEYEWMFDEFLSKPSKIKQIIRQKKTQLLDGSKRTGEKALDLVSNLWRDAWELAIPMMLSYAIYVALLYIFYYLGYFFWIVLFYGVNIFLKIILFFKKNTEVKIKQKIEGIEENFIVMKKIDTLLSHKISNFKDWEISSIAGFVEKNFSNFYWEILGVLEERKKLLKIIKDSEYKDFIDFEVLERYIKNNFNKPVKEMVNMLSKFEKLLENNISLLKKTQTNKAEFSANLTKKELILEHQLELLQMNKVKLEKSLL